MTERVCVHGLGYIGLPTAAALAEQGYDVLGYDTNKDLREKLTACQLQFEEIGMEPLIERVLTKEQLTVVDEVRSADYHLICVPTPLSDEYHPDLSYIKTAARKISKVLRVEDVVITESTVPPGTSKDVIRPILRDNSKSGIDCDSFGLVYCPETVLPGNLLTELRENDRVVGGFDKESCRRAIELYDTFCNGRLYTSDLTTAEFVKLIQNASRDLNIAFANQVAKLAGEHDVRSSEVIQLANTHPRVDILSPGPGVGGHCLPVDPWFLTDTSTDTSLIEIARQFNASMPQHIITLLEDIMNSIADKKIAILGVAYKGGVSDARNSPGLELAELLREGATGDEPAPRVMMTDPYVPDDIYEIHDTETALRDAHSAVVVTDHDEYLGLKPDSVKKCMAGNVVVDTRNILDLDSWQAAGFDLYQL